MVVGLAVLGQTDRRAIHLMPAGPVSFSLHTAEEPALEVSSELTAEPAAAAAGLEVRVLLPQRQSAAMVVIPQSKETPEAIA